MEIVKVDRISKRYGEKTILKDISFSVNEGECFGILGLSGSGKSTLIKIITSQTDYDDGGVFVFGKNILQGQRVDFSQIGIMTDNISCCERLTCYENLELYCDIFGVNKRVILELMNCVGLGDAANKKVQQLSKGMKQRLMFIRALINQPKLLILDEPTSDLDPNTVENIHRMIIELKKRGTAILISTHNMQEAAELCDIVGIINDGCFIEHGKPDMICEKYKLEEKICVIDEKGNSFLIKNEGNAIEELSKRAKNIKIKHIEVVKPSLKDIFMEVTGKNDN